MRPNPYTTYPELPPQLPLPPSQLQRMQRQIDEMQRNYTAEAQRLQEQIDDLDDQKCSNNEFDEIRDEMQQQLNEITRKLERDNNSFLDIYDELDKIKQQRMEEYYNRFSNGRLITMNAMERRIVDAQMREIFPDYVRRNARNDFTLLASAPVSRPASQPELPVAIARRADDNHGNLAHLAHVIENAYPGLRRNGGKKHKKRTTKPHNKPKRRKTKKHKRPKK